MSEKRAQQQNGAGKQEDAPHDDELVIAEAAAAGGADEAPATVVASFDDASGAPPAEPTAEQVQEQLQAELAAERARYAELYDKFQRSAADFQNARRRQDKQTSDAIERAATQVIRKLLPVLDDLALAFDHVPATLTEEQAPWVDGFRQIQRKLLVVLEDEGVTAIPSTGTFDPALHEALSSEPNDQVPSGEIIATLRVGYAQRGHILRPALVRVSA